jgi:hypothetical protein
VYSPSRVNPVVPRSSYTRLLAVTHRPVAASNAKMGELARPSRSVTLARLTVGSPQFDQHELRKEPRNSFFSLGESDMPAFVNAAKGKYFEYLVVKKLISRGSRSKIFGGWTTCCTC